MRVSSLLLFIVIFLQVGKLTNLLQRRVYLRVDRLSHHCSTRGFLGPWWPGFGSGGSESQALGPQVHTFPLRQSVKDIRQHEVKSREASR